MAQSLDLEEQEQLDQIKHFWGRYGDTIIWALIIVFGAIAAWNGWQYWQRKQATGASVLYDEIERAVAEKDVLRVERTLADLKEKFSSTSYAQQGALLAGNGLYVAGKTDEAQAALAWAADHKGDEGLQALARLRLAALALETRTPEDAIKWLDGPMPTEFSGLAADRLGDAYLAMGKKTEARSAFERAYQHLDDKVEYRQLVEFKLNALGVDPKSATSVNASAGTTK